MKRWLLLMFVPLLFVSFTSVNTFYDGQEITVRGAETKEELTQIVFNALKENDFDMLTNYIPQETELDYLRKQSSARHRYMFEQLASEDLIANTKLNFDKVVEEGVGKEMNWAESDLAESIVEQGGTSDKRIYKGHLRVQDLKGKGLSISIDIIKVKNRWFLFQGIRTTNERASTE